MKKYKVSHKSLNKDGYKAEKKRKVASNDRRVTNIEKSKTYIKKSLVNKANIATVSNKANTVSNMVDTVNANVIYGTHAVISALHDTAKLVEKVYVRDSLSSKDMPTVYELCKSHRIPVTTIPDNYKMTELAGTSAHQGLVAIMRDFEYIEIDDMIKLIEQNRKENKPSLIVIMDEIEDPHNVGAIIRTAVAVGAAGVIVPKHRQAPMSGAVHKASAGLLNQIPIARVSNIGVAIEKLKKSHVWVGALGVSISTAGERSELWSLDLSGDLAIIIGNEGKGVQSQHVKDSDFTISIPMSERVESLNASVSGAIVMYEWKRQNRAL